MGNLVLLVRCLLVVQVAPQSLYSACSRSEDCGDNQFCDLAGRKECQCLSGLGHRESPFI